MAIIKPFFCIRPNSELASRVAALPYDVYNRKEACEEVKKEPLSFLAIDRAETQFDDSVDIYEERVYQKAKELLEERIADGTFLEEKQECYFLYQLTMNDRSQTGIVACASIDDYQNQVIKKHENTRADKEADRIRHVDTCNAQTGPIFLAYRSQPVLNAVMDQVKKETPLYQFVSDDGIGHMVWKVGEAEKIALIRDTFAAIDAIYIADGHHRAASAVKVGLQRREKHPDYTGQEEFNYFLSVLFPDDQLLIMDYNRVVKDLNGYSTTEFLEKVAESYVVEAVGEKPYAPGKVHEMGMYLDGIWYRLEAKPEICVNHPVEGLDVSILQNTLLAPLLGIGDPKTDKRIDFVGGIRGLEELERRVKTDMRVAFSMYPTSIGQLFDVADAQLLMPPKSTWFEPKLRSGLFIHRLDG
ncbi:MAG: DUF1015 family protein [Lachnospiraceae bacterium]|nr:DUF1015 family protein [Lachnospiraceae bacterium]